MRYIRQMVERLKSLFRNDEGFVMMATLSIFLFLFVLCASIYAVVDTVNEKIKLQNACDAAAYSAAVVQADGLARMATVNRAMAWTYVQMSNRQMDYIVYKWLKLTCDKFQEDKNNAHDWHAHIVSCVDRQLGAWAILEVAIMGLVEGLFIKSPCATEKGRTVGHRSVRPWSYWCGTSQYNDNDTITINGKTIVKATDYATINSFINNDIVKNIAQLVGVLIDNDKQNIDSMNKSLVDINSKMMISMRDTAETVLKATIKDGRLGDDLSDYSIFLQIPHSEDPYSDAQGKGYFSALRNTEVDELIFLNMRTNKFSNKLFEMFPSVMQAPADLISKLLPNFNSQGGLDQWFMRGRGIYADNKEGCYMKQDGESYRDEESGWVNGSCRLLATARDEGTMGIQRVYKDANLNEGRASVFGAEIDRGNHLLNLADISKTAAKAFKDFLSGGSGETDDDSEDPIEAVLNAQKEALEEIARLEEENIKLEEENMRLRTSSDPSASLKIEENKQKIESNNERIKEINEDLRRLDATDLSQIGTGDVYGGDAVDNAASEAGSEAFGVLSKALVGIFDFLFDNAMQKIDIPPSCDNVHSEGNFTPPMCCKSKETTALFSQYRWASNKWFCLTTAKAYLLSKLQNGLRGAVYCDYNKGKIWKCWRWKKGRGWGHWGFPKWFCGSNPKNFWGIDVVIPLLKENISGGHGYMEHTWDLLPPSGGFFKPIAPLWHGTTSFSRDEYNSCAMFPDGPFNPLSSGPDIYPAFIRGHARIYRDDKKIFDNRYVGARCKPWVLNERFFAGDGTIVVGAALVHKNPFARLFNFLHNDTYVQGNNMRDGTGGEKKTVLSAFDIPKGNSIWTMSAARAAVRRTRRNGAFDKDRMYQITYDPLSDGENLAYVDNTQVIGKAPEDTDSGDAPDIKKGSGYEWTSLDSYDGESHLSRARDADNPRPIWNGCVCDGNERAFKNVWNLCESDWDATLLPLRYAGRTARLYSREKKQFYGDNENKKDYKKRREAFANLSDDYVGAGTNWVWESAAQMNSSHILSNPFMVPFSIKGWQDADDDYFGFGMPRFGKEPFNRLSDDDSEESAKMRNAFLLINNRIL